MNTFRIAAAEYLAEKKKGKRNLDPVAAPLDCLIGLIEIWRIEEAIPLLLEIVDYELDPRSFGVGGTWGLDALYPAACALVELRVEPIVVLAQLGKLEQDDSREAMRKRRLLLWVLCCRVGSVHEAWKLIDKYGKNAYPKTEELLERADPDRTGPASPLLPPPTGQEERDRLLPVPKKAEHKRMFPDTIPKEKLPSTFFCPAKMSKTDLRPREPLIGKAQYNTREFELFEALWNAFGHPEEISWIKGEVLEFLPFSLGLVANSSTDITVSPRGTPSPYWKVNLEHSFPPGTCQPWVVPLGQRRVVFVVAAGHPIDVLDTTLICTLLQVGTEGKSWKDLIGKGPNVPIKCFFPPLQSPPMNIIKDRYMGAHRKGEGGAERREIKFRTDAQICSSMQAVIDGVHTAGLAGLGIVELPAATSANWNGVKILSLRGDPGYYWREGPPNEKAIITIRPLLDSMFQLEYP
ncbi:MAG: hypothetical protein NZ602_05155, partial [Thermoguttaceae bacterium]|nr:hypothetical protein [Thermoguttaceae bacterium]MDW8036715.1 hypothetical protein [Thermoguttaceae bacterium]